MKLKFFFDNEEKYDEFSELEDNYDREPNYSQMQREAYEIMKARQDQEHAELDKQLMDAALKKRNDALLKYG